jgi:hypothetical protein
MQHAILAILSGHEQATRCADALKQAGFTSDEISLLMPDNIGAEELGFIRKTRAAEGFAVGVISGLILGAGFAFLAAQMQLSLQPLNPILAAGPAVAALAMAALFALIMGLIGGLIGMSMSQYAVCKFDRKTRLASSLMAVHTGNANELKVAEKVLRLEGAQEIRTFDENNDHHRPIQLATH